MLRLRVWYVTDAPVATGKLKPIEEGVGWNLKAIRREILCRFEALGPASVLIIAQKAIPEWLRASGLFAEISTASTLQWMVLSPPYTAARSLIARIAVGISRCFGAIREAHVVAWPADHAAHEPARVELHRAAWPLLRVVGDVLAGDTARLGRAAEPAPVARRVERRLDPEALTFGSVYHRGDAHRHRLTI